MAAIKGFGGVITVGAQPLGEIREWSYERDGTEEDTSVMGVTRTNVVNIKVSGTFSMYANHYPGANAGAGADPGQALFDVDAVVALTLHPEGTGTGLPSLVGNIRVKKESVSASHDGFIELDVDYEVDGSDDWTRAAQT